MPHEVFLCLSDISLGRYCQKSLAKYGGMIIKEGEGVYRIGGSIEGEGSKLLHTTETFVLLNRFYALSKNPSQPLFINGQAARNINKN